MNKPANKQFKTNNAENKKKVLITFKEMREDFTSMKQE